VTADYVESSALAKLVLHEPELSALLVYLRTASVWMTSLLTVTEVHRSAARHGPAEMKQADGVLRRMTFVDIDRPVIELAARLQPATLRTLDAIHVASAMQLGSELRSFVTYDQRLADAARAAGLTVVSPGS
jgi:predicted nucleic acid-binding protein